MRKLLLIALFASLFATVANTDNGKQNILIISSGNLEPFRLAIEGLKKGLTSNHIPADLKESNAAEGPQKVLADAKQFSPDLIVAVGSAAARLAHEQFPDTPTVFSMVLYPSLSQFSGNTQQNHITGVALDIPFERQFQTFLRIVPSAKRIGVIFNPAETGKVIEQAGAVCTQLGLTLVPVPVTTSGGVPTALNGIERRVDAMWSVADGTVMAGKMPEYILEYTLQHNIPFMGISPSFVEAGALFTLSQDYTDMGQQTAELCIRILAGAKPWEIPVVSPRKVYLYINMRAADEIGLKIPAPVVQEAIKVFR